MTRLNDVEFCDEIIALIDGTHWKQSELGSHCWVRITEEEYDENNSDHQKGCVIVRRFIDNTVKESDPAPSDPRQLAGMKHNIARNLARGRGNEDYKPIGVIEVKENIPMYRKAQWCIIGMVMKVGGIDHNTTGLYEDIIYAHELGVGDDPDGYRGSDFAAVMSRSELKDAARQMKRIVEQMFEKLPNDNRVDKEAFEEVKNPGPDAGPQGIISRKISIIECWNDNEATSRADVRDLVVNTKEEFMKAQTEG